jgi:hypothetical protein
MAETWVKTYRTPAELLTDVTEAASHGWHIIHQRQRSDGMVSVTFAKGDDLARPMVPLVAPVTGPTTDMEANQLALAVGLVVIGLVGFFGYLVLSWLTA